MNWELSDVQAGFRKVRGIRDQIANIHWNIEKAREFQNNIYFWFIDYIKPLTVWITTNCGIFLTRLRILPDHITCLLRNMYVGQEARVRTGHGTMDCFQTGKGVCKGCILSPCLFVKSWTGWITNWIKIARRNINLTIPCLICWFFPQIK